MLLKCIEKRQLHKACQHLANHGIGCEEYEAIVLAADGFCQLCGVRESDTPRGELVMDHLHVDGDYLMPHKIRGMICRKCNSGVMAKVDGKRPWGSTRTPEINAAVAEYLANAWHLTHPVQPPHRSATADLESVRHGFSGWQSTARLHRLAAPWRGDDTDRSLCGYRVYEPAHPDVIHLYRDCISCLRRVAALGTKAWFA